MGDAKFKIHRQNIVVTKYSPKCVQEAWDNHFSAFGGQDLDKIMLDYDDNSVVRVFDKSNDDPASEFKGAAAVRQMFTGLFKDLSNLSTLAAPVVTVDEAGKQVFLVWECPGVGFEQATDTFIYDAKFKIHRQNIVVTKYSPKSVQEAWDNHFSAFGGQDLDKIMLDYDD